MIKIWEDTALENGRLGARWHDHAAMGELDLTHMVEWDLASGNWTECSRYYAEVETPTFSMIRCNTQPMFSARLVSLGDEIQKT